MKNRILILTAVATSLAFVPVSAQRQRGDKDRNITINTGGEKSITDCAQLKMRIGDSDPIRTQQEQMVPRSAVPVLKVRAAQNGGIHVEGWDRDEYSIRMCLAVANDGDTNANEVLNQVKLTIQNGEVSVQGPSTRDWVAFLLIQTPRGGALQLNSYNGPIGLNEVSGSIEAHNVNGPLTLRGVSGQVRADVQNGPITVAGGGGDFRLKAQNGPLTVALDGYQWDGELEGRTQNGPLTLKLAEGFRSSVLVETSKHSPVTCVAGPCKGAARTWDRPNEIKFGESTPVVRLSTVNGPVTIVSAESDR
jgi:hypothetical protein